MRLPTADPEADFEVYADAVENALDALVSESIDLVVVGQSMGAFAAPIVASRRRAARLVLIALSRGPNRGTGRAADYFRSRVLSSAPLRRVPSAGRSLRRFATWLGNSASPAPSRR